MIFTILIIAVITAVLYFVLSLTLFPLLKISQMKRRLLREGLEAEAVLLNME
jgi:lipopolysaccharide export LptBFGC system permease protein LptF